MEKQADDIKKTITSFADILLKDTSNSKLLKRINKEYAEMLLWQMKQAEKRNLINNKTK